MLSKIVFKTLLFYWQKTALTVVLVGLLIFLAMSSWLFTNHIQQLSDQPLDSLSTELVLQQDPVNKSASEIQISGVIEPFNLQTFSNSNITQKLTTISGIDQFSTALVVWQFDLQNSKTIVGLNVDDPAVGLRKIEDWLMPGSTFFSSNEAEEVILERHFAKLFGYTESGTYEVEGIQYTIVGIVDFTEQSNLVNAQVFMPYRAVLAVLGAEQDVVNQVYVSLKNASELSDVQSEISTLFPELSMISKDSLLNNLSTFNGLMYTFGNYFVAGIMLLSTILSFWVLKINHLEFGSQSEILRTIGWPKKHIQQWIAIEVSYVVMVALVVSLLVVAVFYWGIIPQISIDTLFNQSFEL